MTYFREYRLYGKKNIVRRYEGNPILDPKKTPFPCQGIYNSGVTRFRGKYLMLCQEKMAFALDRWHNVPVVEQRLLCAPAVCPLGRVVYIR